MMTDQSLREALEKTCDASRVMMTAEVRMVLAAHPVEPAPVVTDEAVNAAVDILNDYGHNGLQCDPTPNFVTPVRRALEAAVPLLAPQPDALRASIEEMLVDIDGNEHEHVDGCEGEDTCPACWAKDLRYRLEAHPAPQPVVDREAVTAALHDFDMGHSWGDERFCPQFACVQIYPPRVNAVLALIDGTAK